MDEVIKKYGLDTDVRNGVYTIYWKSNMDSADEILNAYNAALEIEKIMRDADMAEGYQYENITAKIGSLKKAADAYSDALNAYNQNEAIITIGESLKTYDVSAFDTENTEEAEKAFRSWITTMLDGKDANSDFGKALTEVAESRFPQFANELNKVEEAAEGAASANSSLLKVYENLKKSTESLSKAYSDMSENGYISADNLFEVLDEYPELLDSLKIENGQYKISVDVLKTKFETIKQTKIAEYTTSQQAIANTRQEIADKVKLAETNLLVARTEAQRTGKGSAMTAGKGIAILYSLQNQLKEYDDYSKKIAVLSNLNITDFSGSGSGKSAVEKQKEAAEKYFDDLKHQRELDKISQKEYLIELYKANEQYYKSGEIEIDEYASNMEELYDGFKELYKEDFEAKKESLEKQKEEVEKYYDDLIDKINEANDEEDYEEEQAEKRKTIFELKAKIDDLLRDGSQRALARAAELQEELADAEKELLDFETDKARENEIDRLEKEKEDKVASIDKQIENIDTTLNNIDDGIGNVYQAIVDYARAYGVTITPVQQAATGTLNARGGWTQINEKGLELIDVPDGQGNYIPMLPGSKVLTAQQTSTLMALSQGQLPQAMYNSIARSIGAKVNSPAVNNYNQPISITMGDVIIKGNADKQTVADIKKQQENTVRMVLQKIKELQK
jgi:DNA repair exonuclease SbcCD ATPase subunit